MVVQQVILYMMNPIIKIKSYHGKQIFISYGYRRFVKLGLRHIIHLLNIMKGKKRRYNKRGLKTKKLHDIFCFI